MRFLSAMLTSALLGASILAIAPTTSAGHYVTFCPTYNPDARLNACVYVDDNATVVPFPTGIQSYTAKECVIGDICATAPAYTPVWGSLSEPGISSYGYVEVTACKSMEPRCRREFTTDLGAGTGRTCDEDTFGCALLNQMLP